jgi:chromosome partitioning protein
MGIIATQFGRRNGAPNAAPVRSYGSVEPRRRRILVVNAKGGCGKTTIATNLASYYARAGLGAALIDHDPQESSLHWLELRGEGSASIHGIGTSERRRRGITRAWQMRLPPAVERVVVDAPAGVQGMALVDMVREVDAVLVPVLPSPIDIHAASRFIQDLLLVGKVRQRGVQIGVIANRVRENTRVYEALNRFLDSLDIPFVARLRDTQNYIRAAEAGLGVHELRRLKGRADRRAWEQIHRWLEEGFS